MLNRLDYFYKTKLSFLLFGLVELLTAYAFISLAIDSGNLWWYLLTLIFLVGAFKNFVALMRRLLLTRKATRR